MWLCPTIQNADGCRLQRKANGVDMSIDASELEGMSEEELRRRYEQHSRGNAGVPGSTNEDFSDMIAKETVTRKKQRMEKEKRDRDKKGEKGYKF